MKDEILKLRLDYLNTFIILVKTENFSEAAKQLGKTQSTISQQLQELEKAFGSPENPVVFINRTSKKFELTAAGQKIYDYAQSIMQSIQHMVNEIDDISERQGEKLKIISSSIPGEYLLPSIFTRFQQKYPKIEFEIVISNTYEALDALLHEKTTLAAVGSMQNVDSNIIDSVQIGKDDIFIFARNDHPIFNTLTNISDKKLDKNMIIAEMAKYPWIFREKGSATRETFLQNFPEASHFHIGLEFYNNIAVINALQNSDALTALSSFVYPSKNNNSYLRKVQSKSLPEIKREFYLLKNKNKILSNAEKIFWDFVVNLK